VRYSFNQEKDQDQEGQTPLAVTNGILINQDIQGIHHD
jgi:hypothetical protein